ncbi:hypothetical protein MtrunA17_Chr8g0337291 [Medicago truncatula]|uniref:Uncharacterized protein n=1 Tax=Medicago truncatula TaxID=3880 RepID=A0A396GBX3_MEDTR|nr:hypothetical protein MtrunA17_Chr8g0337291 [Medicago truncatula]
MIFGTSFFEKIFKSKGNVCLWLNINFTDFGIRMKCCIRERCDEFVEEASV